MKTRGFRQHARILEGLRRETERANGTVVEIGFPGGINATVAAQLEYGLPARGIPERPLFRRTVPRLADDVTRSLVNASQGHAAPSKRAFDNAARAGAATLHTAYTEDTEGLAPLSVRTREAQRGTQGSGKHFVGRKGPRMIGSVRSWVNGTETGR